MHCRDDTGIEGVSFIRDNNALGGDKSMFLHGSFLFPKADNILNATIEDRSKVGSAARGHLIRLRHLLLCYFFHGVSYSL
jgi:hypothetical protein